MAFNGTRGPGFRNGQTTDVGGAVACARRLAVQLLEGFMGWDPSSLQTLRAYMLSCERLEALQSNSATDSQDLAREVRIIWGCCGR